MTDEQIRELAKESGFEVHDVRLNFRKELITFARAVEAKTVERCARERDEVAQRLQWVEDECAVYPESKDEKDFATRLLSVLTRGRN